MCSSASGEVEIPFVHPQWQFRTDLEFHAEDVVVTPQIDWWLDHHVCNIDGLITRLFTFLAHRAHDISKLNCSCCWPKTTLVTFYGEKQLVLVKRVPDWQTTLYCPVFLFKRSNIVTPKAKQQFPLNPALFYVIMLNSDLSLWNMFLKG